MVNSKKKKKLKRKQQNVSIIECKRKPENFETFYNGIIKELLEKSKEEEKRLGYKFTGTKCLEIEISLKK